MEDTNNITHVIVIQDKFKKNEYYMKAKLQSV